MNEENNQSQIEEFVMWFLTIEDLDLVEKQRFVNHLLEVGTVDEKAFQFIEHTLHKLHEKSKSKAVELRRQLEVLTNAIANEKNPEISAKSQVVKNAEKLMHTEVENFKTEFEKSEKSKYAKEETLQHSSESEEIAHLKEMVGA